MINSCGIFFQKVLYHKKIINLKCILCPTTLRFMSAYLLK